MIIDSVIEYNVNFSKYNPLAGSSYIKLLKELDHPRKGLINDQNTNDKECFIWCLVRYLHPADRNQASITKADKDFWKRLDFKHKKFPVKARDIHKTKKKKKNSIGISAFSYENEEKHPIYVSEKCCEEKLVNLLLIWGEDKRHYVLI